ncbi:phage tail protein [Chromobacterium sp. CV08]|uniref:phage tail protein n=1 Tax=Chromobacterium sp. CV08 TaxID=3133274 RepID=UPI003DAA3736
MQDQLKPINSPDGLFHDGNPYTGELGTVVTSEWLNGMQTAVQSTQQEVLTLLKNSGQNPDASRKDQLQQAVQNIAWGGNSRPTTLAGYGIVDGASKTDLQTAVNNLVAGAPGALNTLQELAAALGNDSNFAASIANLLAGKADKASTLAGYGINDAATATQVNAAAPAGMVAYFAMPNAPAGWLIADGSTKNCKDYPALFTAIGKIYGGDGKTTFCIPNLCGEFIRGWDNGRGIDNLRQLGSWQDATRVIKDYWTDNGWNGAVPDVMGTAAADWDWQGRVLDGAYGTQPKGEGTTFMKHVDAMRVRPRNIALLACIKY